MMTVHKLTTGFPFLFGRAFIEAIPNGWEQDVVWAFPFLFGRAFIEAITLLLRWKT